MDDKRYYFGIDLGTTNSVVAIYDSATNQSHALSLSGSPILKSQVWQDANGTLKVGAVTSNSKVSKIRDVKSSIATNKVFKSDGLEMTSVEVSSKILAQLMKAVVDNYGEMDTVVVTVPAKFDHLQRAATLKAASMAGLKVKNLINEPTAAALAYVDTIEEEQNILVYDLGGGTFDVSIVNIMPNLPRLSLPEFDINFPAKEMQMATVIASDGDVNLGGNDLDWLVVDYAMMEAGVCSLPQDEMNILKDLAVQCKETQQKLLKYVTENGENIFIKSEHVTKATTQIFNRTNAIVSNLLYSHSSLPISRIVLVGGSTKNLELQALLSSAYPKIKIYSNINPDECVALGAAKDSFILSDDSKMSFHDVVSGTYSTVAMNYNGEPQSVKMILKGTPIPSIQMVQLEKSTPEQQEVEIDIFQGESLNFEQNTHIGVLKISDLPNDLDIDEPINCIFSINASGMLTVSAKYRDTKVSTSINIHDVTEDESDDELLKAMVALTDEF